MVPTQVSSTSLDHGSKLRGPSPKSPRVAEQCDVIIHLLTPCTRSLPSLAPGLKFTIRQERCHPRLRDYDHLAISATTTSFFPLVWCGNWEGGANSGVVHVT
ncbi:hypothetical protein TNCV_840351 [Trichonephila clavipes]|nr:hypothetical protein TNCV_840351 [Trichonephila clavipes]